MSLHFFVRDLRGVNIIGDTGAVTECDDPDRPARPFLEVNIFTNQNGNGYYFSELKFNHFFGLRVDNEDEKMSYGLQWISPKQPMFDFNPNSWRASRTDFIIGRTAWSPNVNTINQRTSQFGLRGVTSAGMSETANNFEFRRDTEMTIPIEGQPHRISVDNVWTTGQSAQIGIPGISLRVGNNRRHYNNWDRFFNHVVFRSLNNVVTMDGTFQREGTFNVILPIFDLLQVRQIVGNQIMPETANRVTSYALARVTINRNGFRNARQSLFNMVGGQGDFDLADNNEYNTDFATYRTHVRLSEQNFDRRFSQTHGGYVLSLSTRTRTQLNDMRRFYLFVNLSRSNNIVGVDFNGLRGLNIHTLLIAGHGNFYLLDFALQDSTIQNLEVLPTVNLINSNNILPDLYKGVAYA